MRIASSLYRKNSLYTDVLFFFSFFLRTSANSRAKRARENERGARERKIKNDRLFSSPQSFSYQCHNSPLALSSSARRVWMWGPKVSCQLKFWPFVRKRARLFTVPYFFVSSSGSSAYWYGRPSWFYFCRGAGVGVHGRGREALKIAPLSSLLPKPSPARQVVFALIQDGHA